VKTTPSKNMTCSCTPGIREEDGKLVIVRNLGLNQDHAMVATRVSGEPGIDRLQDRLCPWQLLNLFSRSQFPVLIIQQSLAETRRAP
jgi:hypothetical protein